MSEITEETPSPRRLHAPEDRLESWKEIAVYLERDERTARRWEKDEGLPIRRHRLIKRSSVYAYASELESWRTARKPKASGSHDRLNSVKGSLAIALGGLAVLLIVLFSWKDSWLDRQQTVWSSAKWAHVSKKPIFSKDCLRTGDTYLTSIEVIWLFAKSQPEAHAS